MKPFEEMSPPEWASALELTVKKFVYRIVKYRDKGFRRHAAQQQSHTHKLTEASLAVTTTTHDHDDDSEGSDFLGY